MGGEDTMEEEVLLLVWYCCWGEGGLSVPLCFFSASLSPLPSTGVVDTYRDPELELLACT